MSRILLVSGSSDGTEILAQIIKDMGFSSIFKTQSGNEARRMIGQSEYDLIIINTPLSDEFGREFAVKASESTNSGIILICREDIYSDLSDKLSHNGIFVLAKPLNKSSFSKTLRLTEVTRQRMLGHSNNLKIQSKTEEIKLINRAKKCLMQYLKFTEPQAHRYIEKQAMDTRQTRKDVAKHILSIYEN